MAKSNIVDALTLILHIVFVGKDFSYHGVEIIGL